MGTGLVSDELVVALRVFHTFLSDDSYNDVTTKNFYFENLYWNL